MKNNMDFAEDLVSRSLRNGADQAEVFMKTSKKLSVEIKKQAIDSLTSSSGFGYALRVIKNGSLGFSYSTAKEQSDDVIRNAIESSQYSDEDRYYDLPETAGTHDVEIFDSALNEITEEDAIKNTMLLEQAAFEKDRRIAKVRKASGVFLSAETFICNSRYIRTTYASTSCSAQIMLVAEQNDDSQMGWDFEASRFLHDVPFERIGATAAERAVRMLGARRIHGGKIRVLLDNAVTADFLGIFASSLSSDAVQKGKSLLKDKMEKKVMSTKITITDSGLLARKIGSRPVDDEGYPVSEKSLIKEGILKGYLYNTYTAKKAGTASTGNAVRAGFSSLPLVGATNIFIEAASPEDTFSKEQLMGMMHRGLYITDAMGVHTANRITGDFSIGVTGLWVDKGEIQFPVREAVIAGNMLEFFDRVDALGNDLRYYGNIGAPSLLISDVDLSA